MRGIRAPTRLLVAMLTSALLTATLNACGRTVTAGTGQTVRVALTEYRVIPQSIRFRAGQLTLRVENDGRLAHSLAVSRRGSIVGQTPPLLPGASADLVLSLPPGSYLMSSTLFSDQALGEYGTLTVIR